MSTSHLARAEQYKGVKISAKEFKGQFGGKVTIGCELDAEKVTLLANSRLEKARQLLNTFKAKKGER